MNTKDIDLHIENVLFFAQAILDAKKVLNTEEEQIHVYIDKSVYREFKEKANLLMHGHAMFAQLSPILAARVQLELHDLQRARLEKHLRDLHGTDVQQP